jgi:PleD family two-component response regulator
MSEFKDIPTLIVDPAGHSKGLLRGLLTTLNVSHVVAVANTNEALLSLRQEHFSIVFCNELVGPLDPLDFLKALRRDLQTRDVTVPVVLVSAGADFSKMTAARDAGINDVIAKPVSAGAIERKLKSLLLAPRPFVTAKAFVGPDRRGSGERRNFGPRPTAGEDRRGKSAEVGSIFAIAPRLHTEEPTKS